MSFVEPEDLAKRTQINNQSGFRLVTVTLWIVMECC